MAHAVERNITPLWPLASTSTNATRAGQTTLEGAIYRVNNPIEFNRIHWRATAQNTAAPTARILIYQGECGTFDETFKLVGQATGIVVAAAGNFSTALDASAIGSLVEGHCFVLFGRDSAAGSITFRTHGIQATDLYTANILAGGIPAVFTTALASTGTPASTITPTGFTATTSDLAPAIWVGKA